MSKAQSSAVVDFTILPEGWRPMYLISAREFRGNVIAPGNPNAGELSRVVDLVFEDEATKQQIHKNYSLDRPTYLMTLLDAIEPGQGQDLINSIDWEEPSDVEELFNKPVLGKLYHEEFPIGSGTQRNRVGNVVPIGTNVGEIEQPASRSTLAPTAQTNAQPRPARLSAVTSMDNNSNVPVEPTIEANEN